MAWLSTTMDMGDFGQRSVDVEYTNCNGFIRIEGIAFGGTDMIMYADDDTLDSLTDEIKAHEREELECAAEAHWDEIRERRLEASHAHR